MIKKPLILDVFFLIALIGIIYGIYLHYYSDRFLWIDIPLHFLGGAWIGLTSLWVYFIGKYISPFKADAGSMLFASLLSALAVGLGWEVFEFITGLTPITLAGTLDTIKDVFIDLCGATVAWMYFRTKLKKLNDQYA